MPSASRIRVRMCARPIDEPHRVSSELELLVDLTFVVAVAAATTQFARSIADGDGGSGLLVSDYLAVTVGYVIMRSGLVAQWVRAGIEYPAGRRTAFRYAGGISALQVGWIIRLVLAQAGVVPSDVLALLFLGLVILELIVPRWAERAGPTNWHPHHIAERYGLFTIILLEESVLADSTGVQDALRTAQVSGPLVGVAAAGLVLLFALWWLYFLEPAGDGLAEHRERSYLWGHGHYGIFASLAALGAGLKVAVEQTAHPTELSPTVAGYAVAGPTAVFLLLLWAVHRPIVERPVIRTGPALSAGAAIAVAPLAATAFGVPAVVALTAAVAALLVVGTLCRPLRMPRRSSPVPGRPHARVQHDPPGGNTDRGDAQTYGRADDVSGFRSRP